MISAHVGLTWFEPLLSRLQGMKQGFPGLIRVLVISVPMLVFRVGLSKGGGQFGENTTSQASGTLGMTPR